MNGLDPYLGLAKEVRDKIQIIIDDAEEGGGLGCLINCTDPDEQPVVAEALDHVFNYLKIAARLMESAVKCIEECEGIETETETATFDQTTVRRLKEIVSSHARNLGCGGTCLDDACQYDGPCDIADIMETLWAASGGIDVVSMPAQTYGTLRAQLAEANAACAAMREALELLREIQSAGVSFEDARVAYVEIQVPKKTLRAIDAFLKRGEKADG